MTDAREIVFDMLMDVEKNHTPSHILLGQTLSKYQYLDKKDRAFISRLFRGTLEYEIRLDDVIGRFSSVRVKKIKPPVKVILRMAACQILEMDHVPDAAACSEAVKLAKKRGLKNLSGFINGVLRSIVRNKEDLPLPDPEAAPAAYLSVRDGLPLWLTEKWLQDYGFETTSEIGRAFLTPNPVTVRVRDRSMIREVTDDLTLAGVHVAGGALLPEALRLSGLDHLGELEAFNRGLITVQDESTMLAALAAGPVPGQRIIDVCAAPGGKSIHLSDLCGGSCHITACDLTAYKTEKIEENLLRTGAKGIETRVRDARVFVPEDEASADIVMADLPCSGLGVIGRKPDIRREMTPEKIRDLAALQREILSVVWSYVKPGGTLIYSTCTLTREENEDNCRWLTEHTPLIADSLDPFLPEPARSPQTAEGILKILPGRFGSDGFFIARFKRPGVE